jgi:hypothetical protein
VVTSVAQSGRPDQNRNIHHFERPAQAAIHQDQLAEKQQTKSRGLRQSAAILGEKRALTPGQQQWRHDDHAGCVA